MAFIGAAGALRAQGAEVEFPSLAEARADFDAWLTADDDQEFSSNDMIVKKALGLGTRG